MQEPTNRAPGAVLPPWRIAQATRQSVILSGARATAVRMGISDTTVSRIAARLPCHRGSILQAARALGLDLEVGEGE